MRPFPREVVHCLTNPVVFVAVVALALIGPGLIVGFNSPPSVPATPNVAVTYSYSTGYAISIFVFDQGGGPVVDVGVNATITPANSSGPTLAVLHGTSGRTGFVHLFWKGPAANYSITLAVGGPSEQYQFTLGDPPAGEIVPGPGALSIITAGTFVAIPFLQVAIGNPNGTVPSGLDLRFNVSQAGAASGPTPSPNFQTIGLVSTDPERFLIPVPNLSTGDSSVLIEVTDARGATVASASYRLFELSRQAGSETRAGSAFVFAVRDLSVFVPVIAVLVGYTGYGRDRTTGALEPLLALPLTRRRIFVHRYLSSLGAILVGASIGVWSLTVALSRSFAVTFPPTLLLGLLGSVALDCVSFLSIVFLLAHLLRSPGGLIAVGLTIALVCSVLWGLIVTAAVSVLPIPSDLLASQSWQGEVSLLSPTGSAQAIVGNAMFTVIPSGTTPILPYEPKVILLGIAIVFWSLAVLSLALWIAITRD